MTVVPSVFAKATASGDDGTGCSVASLPARRSTRLWTIPIVERADRYLSPNCRVEARTSSFAAACRDLYIPQHPVDGRCAHSENTATIPFVKLQSAVSLKCGQQGRDHNLEPLAAHSIRCLPQGRQGILARRIVSAPALSRPPIEVQCGSLALPQCAHRMLAVPARRRAQLVEYARLLRPLGRPVALRHRRHHLAPRAHADSSRHRGHRHDSATLSQGLARTCSVTFLVRQCAR